MKGNNLIPIYAIYTDYNTVPPIVMPGIFIT